MATHYFPTDQVHFTWDAGNEPVLTVADGDTVVFETRDVSDNQIGPDSDCERDRGARLGSRVPAGRPGLRRGRGAGRHARDRDPRRPHQGLGLDGDPARARAAGRRLHRALPAHLRHDARRPHVLPRGHRDPARAVHGHDGRLPGGRERAAGDAARAVRRQPRHAPARARHDAVPAGAGAGRAVQHRRRALLPGRRRDLRHRARGADVRDDALPRREAVDPGAAVPDRARIR